ncbi:MAG: hypothetical protein K0S06_3392 [Microvirga sp.]|jgi:hypothetical protein|nr:hypothetical protein [Microvirga sp.]
MMGRLARAALAVALLAAPASAQDWTSPRRGDGATRSWEKSSPEAQTRPGAQKQVYSEAESKRIGDDARRKAEERQAGWDRKMKAVSGSICRGC